MKVPVKTFGHVVNSIRANSKLKPWIAMAEMIDNSIDAGASVIQITFDQVGPSIRIADDGRGCDDMSRFFDFGGTSAPQDDVSRLGRYGVGGTNAAASLCDIEEVESIAHGFRRVASIQWSAIAERNLDMEFDVQRERPTKSASGTAITLHGERVRSMLKLPRIRAAADYWSKVYAPALLHGFIIAVDGERLSPRPFPKVERERSITGCIQGKSYTARVGILKNESEAEAVGWGGAGFYVACAGRLMFEKPIWEGAEEYHGAAIFAYIELIETGSSKWLLDTHKIDFAEREELFADLIPQIEDLLQAANERTKDVEIRGIEDEMTTLLARAFNATNAYERIREKRNARTNESGSVEQADSGKQRQRAEKSDPAQPGSVVEFPKPKREESWKLQFAHLGNDAGIGVATVTEKTAWMKFNLDNDFIHSNRRSDSLIPLAVTLIWNSADDRRRNRLWASVFHDLEMQYDNDVQASRWLGEVLVRVDRARAEDRRTRRSTQKVEIR